MRQRRSRPNQRQSRSRPHHSNAVTSEPLEAADGAAIGSPRVSPDGKQRGVCDRRWEGRRTSGSTSWPATRSPRQLTPSRPEPLSRSGPADGQRVAFQSDRDGDLAVFWQRAEGRMRPNASQSPRLVRHIFHARGRLTAKRLSSPSHRISPSPSRSLRLPSPTGKSRRSSRRRPQ